MSVVIFVLGLPGSGKTAASRHIEKFSKENKWVPQRFKDYEILYNMYQNDEEGNRFSSTYDRGYDGFDVHDLSAFDEALIELERRVSQRPELTESAKELIIIEFSRDDYCKALSFFITYNLQNAHFLFIDADIDTCIKRIKYRADHPKTSDDRYVSEYIFEFYYQRDHRDYLNSVAVQLQEQFGIHKNSIQVIHNGPTVSEQRYYEEVKAFATSILMPKA